MDALIRLDPPMPIAQLPENNVNIPEYPNRNLQNRNPQQRTTKDHSTSLVEIPDVIDLTVPQVEVLILPNLEKDKTAQCTSNLQVLGEGNGGFPSTNHHIPIKHKLPLLTDDHCPPKVLRIDSNDYRSDFNLAPINSNRARHFQNTHRPGSSRDSSINSPDIQSCKKNHTITSGELNEPNDLEIRFDGSIIANTSAEINLFRRGPVTNTKGASKYVHVGSIEKPIQSESVHQNEVDRNKESHIFYQLLDMFPDIDFNFLQNQCRMGLDINQITENILKMDSYPKGRPWPFPGPKIELNINVNNLINPVNSLSTATQPNVIDQEIKVLNEKNSSTGSDFSLNVVPGAMLIPTSNNGNQDPTISHISERNKDEENRNNLAEIIPQQTGEEVVLKEKVSQVSDEGKYDLHKEHNKINVNQLNFLLEIFPDADLTFLEEKSKLQKDDLTGFITEKLEKRDYPKITHHLKNEVEDESIEIGLYTTNFKLENFIKIFPDPFGYFLDYKRNRQWTEHGFEFLKRRYRLHSLKMITKMYKEFNYNLIKTCEFLDVEKQSRYTARSLRDVKMPEKTNLPFLQEACFIEHKAEIKQYLDGIAEAKRQAYEQAEAKGELIECGCCYQSVIFEDCAACNEGHLFCKDCVRKSVEVRIGDALTTFPCLQDCGSVFSLQLLEVLVDATMFSRLLQRIQLDEVKSADIEGLEVCPFCEFAIILPPETNIFKCLNPECLKESCRKCHKPSHIPQRCEELESDDQARARKYIEDEMTRALVRVCYKCKKSFIKTEGCNKMICTCGAKMCYICREPIVDYTHFNGPGGDQKKKCPLYSTEKLLHVDAVKAVAQKALEEVTSKNPELKLKHDPSKILPAAETASTTLPPGVNEEAGRFNILQYHHQFLENQRNLRAHIMQIENDFLLHRPQLHIRGANGHRNWAVNRPQVIQHAAREVVQPLNLAIALPEPQGNQQNINPVYWHNEDLPP